jgi:nucleotide-binding universal stress UspA family protein
MPEYHDDAPVPGLAAAAVGAARPGIGRTTMYDRILVPVDGSATASRGVDEAIALAAKLGSALHLLHVVDVRPLIGEAALYPAPAELIDEWQKAGEQLLADAVARARGRGVAADGVTRCDPGRRVCDLILQEARDMQAGLIVMGTHGRHGFRRLTMGSDAELVLREAPVPVLLVRAADAD